MSNLPLSLMNRLKQTEFAVFKLSMLYFCNPFFSATMGIVVVFVSVLLADACLGKTGADLCASRASLFVYFVCAHFCLIFSSS